MALPAGVELGEVADQIRRRFRVASYAAGALFSSASCVLVLGSASPFWFWGWRCRLCRCCRCVAANAAGDPATSFVNP